MCLNDFALTVIRSATNFLGPGKTTELQQFDNLSSLYVSFVIRW